MNDVFPMHERYRQMVELSPDSIKEVSLDGEVMFVNAHGLARIAAENAERVLGKRWSSLWPEEVRPIVEEAISAAASGEKRQFDAECTTPTGEHRHWLVSTSPLRNEAGQVEAVLAVNRDVTDRRQAELALRTLNQSLRGQPGVAPAQSELAQALDEKLTSVQERAEQLEGELDIARAAQRLAEAVAEQAQKGESVGQLLAGIVHDLNNVLQTALGAVELIRLRREVDAKDQRLLEMAETALQQGAVMSRRLLGFARHHPYLPEETDIDLLVSGMLPLLRQAAGEGRVLTYTSKAKKVSAMVDPHTFERAVMNLVVNARDACQEGGKIDITVDRQALEEVNPSAPHAPGNYVTLCVQDNGQGIDPDVRAHLFEAYFTTKAAGEGTGLGLSQVYGAVRQANGFVEVESTPGAGAQFTLGIPSI